MSHDIIDYGIDTALFEESFLRSYNPAHIRELASEGTLSTLHNRWTCWLIFLSILPESPDHWIEAITNHRQSYARLQESQNVTIT